MTDYLSPLADNLKSMWSLSFRQIDAADEWQLFVTQWSKVSTVTQLISNHKHLSIAMPCKVTKIFFHNIAFIIHKLKLISPQEIIRGGAQYENKCTCIQCNKKKNNKENFGWNLLFIECRFLLALKIIDLVSRQEIDSYEWFLFLNCANKIIPNIKIRKRNSYKMYMYNNTYMH